MVRGRRPGAGDVLNLAGAACPFEIFLRLGAGLVDGNLYHFGEIRLGPWRENIAANLAGQAPAARQAQWRRAARRLATTGRPVLFAMRGGRGFPPGGWLAYRSGRAAVFHEIYPSWARTRGRNGGYELAGPGHPSRWRQISTWRIPMMAIRRFAATGV